MSEKQKTKKHHFIRTPLAVFFGFIAVSLLLFSILTFWLNRTLTDTNAYTNAVGGIVDKPEVQEFLAQRSAKIIIENAPVDEISKQIFSDKELSRKTKIEITNQTQNEIYKRVLVIVQSPDFAVFWQNTVRSTHTQIIEGARSNDSDITLDFSEVLYEAIEQLEKTELVKESDLLRDVDTENLGILAINKDELGPAGNAYNLIQGAVVGVIVLALLFAAASIFTSVHHTKTLRRVLLASGILSLLVFALVSSPSYVETQLANQVDQEAAIAVYESVTSDLKLFLVVYGISAITLALGSKLYQFWQNKKSK